MILITGATGTNGQELIRQLAATGQPLRAMIRNPAKAQNLAAPNVELFQGDFDNPASLAAALNGVDKAFLLTPVDSRFVQWNTAFIHAAQRAKLKHLVKFSGMGAGTPNAGTLMNGHHQTDELLRNFGIPFTILQPNSFFQNMLWSAATIKSQNAFYLPLGTAAQSLVDVRDINAVAAHVLTTPGHEGQTYIITGPQSLTYADLAATLSKLLNRTIQYIPVPPAAAADAMRQNHMPAWNVTALTELYAVFARGDAATVTDTIPKLLHRPATTFDQWARANLAAFQ